MKNMARNVSHTERSHGSAIEYQVYDDRARDLRSSIVWGILKVAARRVFLNGKKRPDMLED